jgi:hypothetical protein
MITHMVGTIERRILVSYRVDPDVAAALVPAPFRVATVRGVAIAGICMIRLTELRPRGLPRAVGLTTENVAHRWAVEWDGPDGPERGVYVPRRDTSSRAAAVAGGRLFPGPMHKGRFVVDEDEDRLVLDYASGDGAVAVSVRAVATARLPAGSVFDDLATASSFFRRDSTGWSPARTGAECQPVELCTEAWNVAPLDLRSVRSSWFDDRTRFPAGSVELDSGLVMRSIAATWVAR